MSAGRAGKRKGFGWIARLMHEGGDTVSVWRNSQMQTRARSQDPKQRDNKRVRRNAKRRIARNADEA